MNTESKEKKVENWDNVTKTLLVISIFLLLFSFVAPYLFINSSFLNGLDFSNTGQIGDTLGGIMNPFIALVGIILTFLAFYMQIKANQIQRQIFYDGLHSEKEKDTDREKKENETRLKIIKALLNSLVNFYSDSGKYLKEFIDEEKKSPLKVNLYKTSTSASYQNFLKLDILESYKSLVYYFKDNRDNEWEDLFIKVLNILDFYDKMLVELRSKYQTHTEKKFNLLMSEGEKLNDIMNGVLADQNLRDFEINRVYLNLTNTETDFQQLQSEFLQPFIRELVDIRDENDELIYIELLNKLSSINKKIGIEKFQSDNYSNNLQEYYDRYFLNNDSLKRIQDLNDMILIN